MMVVFCVLCQTGESFGDVGLASFRLGVSDQIDITQVPSVIKPGCSMEMENCGCQLCSDLKSIITLSISQSRRAHQPDWRSKSCTPYFAIVPSGPADPK